MFHQQKKTDEKQDKIIEQLKGNQLALTSGFKDLIETNKDIITLNRELPQLTYEEEKTSSQQSPLYNLGQDFGKEELDYIKEKNLVASSKLPFLSNEEFLTNKEQYDKISKDIGSLKRSNTINLNKMYKNLDKTDDDEEKERIINEIYEFEIIQDNLLERRSILQKYLEKINYIKKGEPLKVKQGQDIRKYKRPRRNAYKIQNNQYGGLMIDVSKLFKDLILNAYRGGKLVYETVAD